MRQFLYFSSVLLTCGFFQNPACAIDGTDITPGTVCSVEDAVTMTANPAGTGGYILTCDGGVWAAEVTVATPTANGHIATKNYVDTVAAGGSVGASVDACLDDDTTDCAIEETRSDDDPDFIAANILEDVNILGVTGTTPPIATDCTNDSAVKCNLEATRSNDDPQFIASNIRTGTNILGVTGNIVESSTDCVNDSAVTCTLEATRSNDDAQFTAGNIKDGINILGVTGTYLYAASDCTNDTPSNCTLSATRSASDAQFTAANIKSGVNILGVTGTYTGSFCTYPASCTSIGAKCSDNSVFAGFMIYGTTCMRIYATEEDQSKNSTWKNSTGTNDISTDDHIDGQVNVANLNSAVGNFPAISICDSLNLHSKTDWYLPARQELDLLWRNRTAINANAKKVFETIRHWTSTESSNNNAFYQDFSGTSGPEGDVAKNTSNYGVRCIRRD